MFFATILIIIITVMVMIQVSVNVSATQAWFSLYGDPSFARHILDGTDWGQMSKLDCSWKCGRTDSCNAFQYKKLETSLGSCVFFNYLTLKKWMISSPGTLYYEKRTCALTLHMDATVQYRSDFYNTMFSGNTVMVYQFELSGSSITGVIRMGQKPISDIYPGYTTTVDAGFEMPDPFSSTSITILLKGTRESCFKRDAPALLFVSCGASVFLRQFFTQTGLTKVDTVAVLVKYLK